MAKRKSKYVQKLRPTEEAALRGLWRTGVMTKEQFEKEFSIKAPRLKQMMNSKYVKTNGEKIYLETKGIKHCKDRGMSNRYTSNFKTFAHDYQLSKEYLSRSKTERESWKTEKEVHAVAKQAPVYNLFRELMEKSHSRGKMQATPDAIVQTAEGKWMAIEVVTRNYKEEDINQKVAFASKFLNGGIKLIYMGGKKK